MNFDFYKQKIRFDLFSFKWEVRKEALDYLGYIYKKECINGNWSNDIQKQLTWIANCIIHLYYQKTVQDK